jgi:hypothetical protein
MGESSPPPRAMSLDEFDERLDPEWSASQDSTALIWRLAATVLFVDGMIFCAWAVAEHHWWLWVGMFVPLTVVFVMAARAVRNMERDGELPASERAYPNLPG